MVSSGMTKILIFKIQVVSSVTTKIERLAHFFSYHTCSWPVEVPPLECYPQTLCHHILSIPARKKIVSISANKTANNNWTNLHIYNRHSEYSWKRNIQYMHMYEVPLRIGDVVKQYTLFTRTRTSDVPDATYGCGPISPCGSYGSHCFVYSRTVRTGLNCCFLVASDVVRSKIC